MVWIKKGESHAFKLCQAPAQGGLGSGDVYKRQVKSIDPNAFLIVCEAHEILGDGFREYKHNDL